MTYFKKYQQFTAKYLHTDTVFKAFIANSFVTALIAIFTIEARRMLDSEENQTNLKEIEKSLISFCIGLGVGLITYLLMWLIFNYGGGMVTINRQKSIVTPLFEIAKN